MISAILALALAVAPPQPALDVAARVDQVVARLEVLEDAARRLDEAELQLATAKTPAEHHRAWRAWWTARADLRAALRRSR